MCCWGRKVERGEQQQVSDLRLQNITISHLNSNPYGLGYI